MTENTEHTESRLTRRGSLLTLGGLAATVGAGAWGSGLLGDDDAEASGAGPAAVRSGLVTCVLSPELTEGPYYVPNERLRRNITEGKPGAALLLDLKVLNASTCRTIRNASVDIWHCDALGVYSGDVAGNPGTNFLRGIQRTNAKGIATFRTIYPGWYPGRAVHIHVKVHVGGDVVHTGQLFFPAAISNAVYRRAPYRGHGTQADTPNATDAIFRNGGSKGMLKLRRSGTGYVGSISMGVQVA
jgi:hypothetical protein